MVGIIGAGISGLTLAFELEKAGIDYILIEASDKPGGSIKSEKYHDYLLELGPNSVLGDSNFLAFINELGLENDLIQANSVSKSRFILRDGEYEELPDSPSKIMTGNFFSLTTRLKIVSEALKSKKISGDETVSEFIESRFGKEVLDYVVNPFISGIFAGDPDKILISQAFPVVAEMIEKHGSVIKALQKEPPARRESYNFKDGMQSFPKAIASKLKNIRYNTEVADISKEGNSYILQLGGEEKIQVSKIVIAIPAHKATGIFKNFNPAFSELLGKIYYPPMVVAHTSYEEVIVRQPLNGFGALHPKVEERFTAGVIWTSSIFPERCPKDEVLFSSFIGGSQYVSNASKDEPFIKNKVQSELNKLYHIKGDPKLQKVFKWEKSIPQYDKNIVPLKKMAEDLENQNIYSCASWKDGISISDCINNAKKLSLKFIPNN